MKRTRGGISEYISRGINEKSLNESLTQKEFMRKASRKKVPKGNSRKNLWLKESRNKFQKKYWKESREDFLKEFHKESRKAFYKNLIHLIRFLREASAQKKFAYLRKNAKEK